MKTTLKELKSQVKSQGTYIDPKLDLRYKDTWMYLAGLNVQPVYKKKFTAPQSDAPQEPQSVFGKEDSDDEVFDFIEDFERVFKVSIFKVQKHELKSLYRNLSKVYHPDLGGHPQDFRFVTNLYKKALEFSL